MQVGVLGGDGDGGAEALPVAGDGGGTGPGQPRLEPGHLPRCHPPSGSPSLACASFAY